MATRTINVTIKVKITNDKVDKITDCMLDDLVCNMDYEFKQYGDFELETEIIDAI